MLNGVISSEESLWRTQLICFLQDFVAIGNVLPRENGMNSKAKFGVMLNELPT